MKSRLNLVVTTVTLCLVMLSTPAQADVTGRIIVIDPGHGGTETGSTACETLLEKDANLDVAERLQTLLVEKNLVILTRDDDYELTNTQRATIANDANADIMVSIHFNGSTDPNINYTQGLYAKWKKDIDLAATLHQPLTNLDGVTDGGLLQFASGAILKADMPATLQEVAFISNPLECTRLSDGTHTRQQLIADLLYEGIDDWFSTPIIPTKPGNR